MVPQEVLWTEKFRWSGWVVCHVYKGLTGSFLINLSDLFPFKFRALLTSPAISCPTTVESGVRTHSPWAIICSKDAASYQSRHDWALSPWNPILATQPYLIWRRVTFMPWEGFHWIVCWRLFWFSPLVAVWTLFKCCVTNTTWRTKSSLIRFFQDFT